MSPLFGFLLLFAILYGCGEKKSAPQLETHQITQDELGEKARCPVCGMGIMVSSRTSALEYEGEIYYFCSEEERAEFMKDPGKFLFQEKEEKKAVKQAQEEPEISDEEIKALGYELRKTSPEEIDQIVLCPGCDRYLAVALETPALEKDGEIYYFCRKACMRAFLNRGK
jgi:YHS domain-containing protein